MIEKNRQPTHEARFKPGIPTYLATFAVGITLTIASIRSGDKEMICPEQTITEPFELNRSGNPYPAIDEARRLNNGLMGVSDSEIDRKIHEYDSGISPPNEDRPWSVGVVNIPTGCRGE